MKILTVRQPWAWAIIHGGKDVENRTWYTGYGGPLLIHAAAQCSRAEYDGFREFCYAKNINFSVPLPWYTALPLGCIVGKVRLRDCRRVSQSVWHNPDCWAWNLTDPVRLPHIKLKGRLGLFDAPLDLLHKLGLPTQ